MKDTPTQLLLPFPIFAKQRFREASTAENHHLSRKESGLYQLRVTVDRGPKFVGVRIKLGLGTRDGEEARKRRDVILSALEKAKLVAV